jgi:hypothetical protein
MQISDETGNDPSDEGLVIKLPLVDPMDPRLGIYQDDDEMDEEDAAIMADIFLYHLHYLHAHSRCPVCEDEGTSVSQD